MVDNNNSVVFFGSGPVAARSLELLSKKFDVEAVITKPKPKHHKQAFPVIAVAKKLGINIYEVSSKNDVVKLVKKNAFKSLAGVLVDFGIIVPQSVIDAFPKGIVNSHFSILPEWRGADPITFSVLSGQKTTGVSLMVLVEEMDEGPLIAYGEYELPKDITTPALTNLLVKFSDMLLKAELPKYLNKDIKPSPQSVTGRKVSYSRKLTKADGNIDWNKSAELIEREIRAFLDWPRSRTVLFNKDIIITKARVVETNSKKSQIGKPVIVDKQFLRVQCDKNLLDIERLIPSGKREISAKEFINGLNL